jgi:malate dehydrogenase (oxaloacetate-decarboxylating)
MDYAKESLRLHGEWKGKIEVITRVPTASKQDLSLAYTPGVAQPCLEIQKDVDLSYELTRRWNMCLVVTDGTAVLGLGDIGPEAGCPSWRASAFCSRPLATWTPSRFASSPRRGDVIVNTST